MGNIFNIDRYNLIWLVILEKYFIPDYNQYLYYARAYKEGTLIHKKSTSKGNVYRYFYVKHYQPKIQWCFLGKYEKLPQAYRELFEETNQRQTFDIRDKLELKI
jgi:hypothetical protein